MTGRRILPALAAGGTGLALLGALPMGSGAAPTAQTAASLQQKISKARAELERKRGRERVLSGDVAAYSRRIRALQDDIAGLQRRQNVIQGDLDRRRGQLVRTQAELRRERARLARLQARLAESRRVLSERLIALYKAGEPDILTVVLEADGFADLLERGEFIRRVGAQDHRIVTRVRQAKAEATATAKRLDRLEARQQRLTSIVLRRRDEVARNKNDLLARRGGYASARAQKAALLRSARESRAELESHVEELERESAKVTARLQGMSGPLQAGPVRRGSGSMIWPVSGPITGNFGEFRGDHYHAGVDIAAPSGTPIRAAAGGRVVLLGWTGGYGNYTCVQHTGAMSTCYAHQSRYGTSNGASVSQGQVIGYVGNTGYSFGAHLHFEVRINGSPVNPMNYL